MMLALHHDPQTKRSAHLAAAMFKGASRLGINARIISGFEQVCGDVGIAYGWAHPRLFDTYLQRGGHFVYIDLGWWKRKPPNDVLNGYHKVVVDGREPGPYFRRGSKSDRFAQIGQKIGQWRTDGNHILVAGMSEKSARTRGFEPQAWEKATIGALKKIYPNRPVVYRPKPSWNGASPIIGAGWSPPTTSVGEALRGAWAAVCCHSNVSVDALCAGIPMHVEDGVARAFSLDIHDLGHFEPWAWEGREQLMADIAYCQFTPMEMAEGVCLRHLLDHTPLGGTP